MAQPWIEGRDEGQRAGGSEANWYQNQGKRGKLESLDRGKEANEYQNLCIGAIST